MTGSIGIGELLARVDAGEDLLLLDVRNEEEFAAWRLEGRRPVETINVPYFGFIQDPEGSIARVPGGREVVVLCAKGGSSEMVSEMMREAGRPARNIDGGMVAYGDHLQAVRVPLAPAEAARFEVWQVNRRGKGCLSYVVRSMRDAIVVDPSRRVGFYVDLVAKLGARIVRVLDTHVHADHVSGGPELAARVGAPYFASAGPGTVLGHGVVPIAPGERLLPGVAVEVVPAPGHTPGSVLVEIGERCVLTGDTLFVSSVGRPDLGGDVEAWGRALFRTLRERIARLPDDALVLPGHCAGAAEIGADGIVAARLGDLRRGLPELRIASEERFVEAMRAAARPAPPAYAEILRANLGLTRPDGEKVVEWELGKNECAASARTGG